MFCIVSAFLLFKLWSQLSLLVDCAGCFSLLQFCHLALFPFWWKKQLFALVFFIIFFSAYPQSIFKSENILFVVIEVLLLKASSILSLYFTQWKFLYSTALVDFSTFSQVLSCLVDFFTQLSLVDFFT